MAKRKKRTTKKTKTKLKPIVYDIIGVVLMFIGAIALLNIGRVGQWLTVLGMVILGKMFFVLFILIIFLGIYYIVKREHFTYKSVTLIGFIILLLSIVLFLHLKYVESISVNGFAIFTQFIEDSKLYFDKSTDFSYLGTGFIGSIISMFFIFFFDYQGTRIASIILGLIGFSLFSGKSVLEYVRYLIKKAKEKPKKPKTRKVKSQKPKVDVKKIEDEYEKEKDLVISDFKVEKPFKDIAASITDEIEDAFTQPLEEKFEIQEEAKAPVEKKVQVNESKVETEIVEPAVEEDVVDLVFKSDDSSYKLPPISLLGTNPNKRRENDNQFVEENAKKLEQTLSIFGVNASVVTVNIGPSVTQYELEIQTGTKLSKIVGLSKEIALALAAKDVRIQAPIPGKSTIGIEIPNDEQSMVVLREVLEASPQDKKESKLLIGLGRDIMGRAIHTEINRMPHLLVAGATGSGKSVCINSMLISIIMRAKPEEVKLLLIDPKMVELNSYNGVPHLLMPVVTDPRKANVALKKVVSEMERRYELFSASKTRNIAGYNAFIETTNEDLPKEEHKPKLPLMVVVIDELADLMMVASKDVEDSIMRITQMARAAGIHLIVATQRPSTDVITGIIKANIPSRIAFGVSSSIDSRTILDMSGAEKLLGKGDMLFVPMGENHPIRIQGAFVSDEEVTKIVDFVINQQKANYQMTLDQLEEMQKNFEASDEGDVLYDEVLEFVLESRKASASLLQRRFRIGYNRASRLIDLLESKGIIGPQNGSKPREVLASSGNEENN
jgi:S-DNA-T family DNA segregation ATPase FtsK/SpoIIIE